MAYKYSEANSDWAKKLLIISGMHVWTFFFQVLLSPVVEKRYSSRTEP